MNDTAPPPSGPTASLSHHMVQTLKIGMPLVVTQMAQMAMGVVDTLMVGRLGAAPLAAVGLASATFFVVWVFGSGFSNAVIPIAATARGQNDERGVRRAVRMGVWVVLLYAVPALLLLSQTRTILLMLGQDPGVANDASDYLVIAMWSIVPALVALSLRSFAIVLEQSGTVMVATILAAVANACLNWVFIYGNLGAPALGLQGAALATVGAHVLGALWLVGWSSRHALAKRYTLFQRFHVPDREAFREVLRLGFPMGATVLAEVTLFYAASLMMGWISVLALAAHGIAIQIASMAFMIPLGLSSAATARIGLARGRDDDANLARAAHAAIMIAGGFAVVTASIMWLVPDPLAALFLSPDDPQTPVVIAAAVPLIMVAAVFQLADAMQATGAGLLRGLKDTRVPMLIAIASYWLVGLPTAYFLAFKLGYGGVGVWSGLATGLAAAAIAMNWRFARRKNLGLM